MPCAPTATASTLAGNVRQIVTHFRRMPSEEDHSNSTPDTVAGDVRSRLEKPGRFLSQAPLVSCADIRRAGANAPPRRISQRRYQWHPLHMSR